MPLFIALHNIHSVQRVIDMVRVVKAFKNIVSTLIITKAVGAAAQSGIPEAFKIAFKESLKIIYLQDLNDIIELVNPEKVYLITPIGSNKKECGIRNLIKELKEGKRVVIIFCGLDAGFTKSELKLGEPLFIDGLGTHIGPAGEAAIILYEVKKSLE